MARKIEKLFRAPYAMPNGLQLTDAGLWIVDQITDRVALMEVSEPHDYGVTRMLGEIQTESSTTSGLTYGDGTLWLAANGPGDRWRPSRPTDASSGEILRVDPDTGKTIRRYPLPGGGGTHGIEHDSYEHGTLWLTTLKSRTISQVRIADWSVVRTVPLLHGGDHGMVRVEDGIWVAARPQRLVLKLGLGSGEVLDRIEILASEPEPHGLSAYGNDLLYCDASTGWVVKITL